MKNMHNEIFLKKSVLETLRMEKHLYDQSVFLLWISGRSLEKYCRLYFGAQEMMGEKNNNNSMTSFPICIRLEAVIFYDE